MSEGAVLHRFLWSDGSRSSAYLVSHEENFVVIVEGRPDGPTRWVPLNNPGDGTKFVIAWEPVPLGDQP